MITAPGSGRLSSYFIPISAVIRPGLRWLGFAQSGA
jgi:hypothetical protein